MPRTRIEKHLPRSWNAASIERLREMYVSGVSTEVIAEFFVCSVNAIRQQASKHNIYRTAGHLEEVHRAVKLAYRSGSDADR